MTQRGSDEPCQLAVAHDGASLRLFGTWTGIPPQSVQAGRLRAARVGGKVEYVFRDEWLDEWLESLATPVVVSVKRRA